MREIQWPWLRLSPVGLLWIAIIAVAGCRSNSQVPGTTHKISSLQGKRIARFFCNNYASNDVGPSPFSLVEGSSRPTANDERLIRSVVDQLQKPTWVDKQKWMRFANVKVTKLGGFASFCQSGPRTKEFGGELWGRGSHIKADVAIVPVLITETAAIPVGEMAVVNTQINTAGGYCSARIVRDVVQIPGMADPGVFVFEQGEDSRYSYYVYNNGGFRPLVHHATKSELCQQPYSLDELGYGQLTVNSTPKKMAVTLDGMRLGATPVAAIDLVPGEYNLVIDESRYHTATQKVAIAFGKRRNVTMNLQAKTGTLRVTARVSNGRRVPATVFVNRQPKGKTPYEQPLMAGVYELEVSYPQYAVLLKTINIKDDNETAVAAKLVPSSDGGEMLSITGGHFVMGEDLRSASVDDYQIHKTEVTVAHYERCVKAGWCSANGLKADTQGKAGFCNWGESERADHPINCVDWYQARSFCAWAGGRLPTEAQWERAARGLRGRLFPWGDDMASCHYVVYGKGGAGCGKKAGTWPVCSKPAGNTFEGACDFSGNVWEWLDTSVRVGPSRGNSAFDVYYQAGGSWGSAIGRYVYATTRTTRRPTWRDQRSGFRCALPSQESSENP